MPFKDYYKVLGVARDATPDENKLAYRKPAHKSHPDASVEYDAEARFKGMPQPLFHAVGRDVFMALVVTPCERRKTTKWPTPDAGGWRNWPASGEKRTRRLPT